MFKKLVTIIVATALALSMASSAFANFADMHLIRVYYDRAGAEIATDLGLITGLVNSTIPTSTPTSTKAGSFGSLTTGYVAYFALDRTTSQLWVSGSTTTASTIVGGSTGIMGLKSGTVNLYSYYSNQGGANTEFTGLASAINSYKNKISATQGNMALAIANTSRLNTEVSLASLIGATSGSVAQNLYFWNNALTTVAVNKIGVAVATITTNFDGSTTISPPPAAATIPDAPTIGTATATGDGLASITFTEPASNGGSPISLYTVTSNPGNITGTGVASPVDVLGLTNGVAYTFSVTATNSVGTSDASGASNSITTSPAPPTTFALDFISGGNGTLTGTASQTINSGADATPVNAVPAAGYHFVNWTGTGGFVTSTSIQLTVTNVTAAQTITANFAIDTGTTYVVNFTSGGNGTLTGSTGFASQTINSGASTTEVTAVPATGYHFVNWTGTGGLVISTSNKLTVTNVTAEQTITAHFTTATVPGAPAIGTATGGNAQASVSFTAPASDGGSAIIDYTVTSNDGKTATGTASPITVTGLANGTAYTFTVTARNSVGSSLASAASNSVTPSAGTTVPGAPAIGTATAGNALATVSFTAGTDGGSAIIDYTVTSNDGKTATGAASPIAVTGLTNGTAYTFAVTARNSVGSSLASATSNSVTPSVVKSDQIITFGTAPIVVVGGSGMVSAIGGASGLPVTFKSTTLSVCTVSDSTVMGLTAGTCAIAANQTGNITYNPASQVIQNITVGRGNQTILSFNFSQNTVNVGETITASATGGATGFPVTFKSTTPTVCNVNGQNGSTIYVGTSGTCTIAADQAGDANYNAANPVLKSITAGKSGQTITIIFDAVPAIVVGGSVSVSATASSGLKAISFSSATPTVCTVIGSTVTGLTAGNCTITADQQGNDTYNSAPQVIQRISVGKGNQTITFGAVPTVVAGGRSTVSATANSGLTVTFFSTTPSVCTISNSIVTGVSYGTCSIAAYQAGNDNYNSATLITPITVGKGNQTITFGTAPTVLVGGSATVSATVSSGLPVTFKSATPTVCTVKSDTGVVTGVTAGTCTIAADQAGNDSYNAAPQVILTVGNGSQTIGPITFTPPTLTAGDTTTASATATSGLPVTFSSKTDSICTVSGSTVTAKSVGTCFIVADQAGNATNNAASQVFDNITVGQAVQTIAFAPPTTANVGASITVNATGGAFGNPVTFSSTPTTVCSISGSTVTFLSAGTCTITANLAGNVNYKAATQDKNITVNATVPGAPTGVTATGGSTQATVTFIAPNSSGGKDISGYTVTSNPAGGTDTNLGTTSLTHVITGLTNGTSYTFTVIATNGVGPGPASTQSTGVTPATTFTVTPKVTLDTNGNANGSITVANGSSSKVEAGKTTIFNVTSNTNYQIAAVTGCGGTLSGTTYTTAALYANCTVTAAFVKKQTKGDLNGDNNVSIADALLALKIAIGLTPPSAENIAAAPLGAANGKIDIADAVAILNYVNNPNHQW